MGDSRTRALQSETDRVIFGLGLIDPKTDLANERAKCSFDVPSLTLLINGGHEALDRRYISRLLLLSGAHLAGEKGGRCSVHYALPAVMW